MNESAPDVAEAESNIESFSDWRELKEKAPVQADTYISEINGYEGMSLAEKIEAIDKLLSELEKDNKNRFIAKHVAHEAAILEETDRHENRMCELRVAA